MGSAQADNQDFNPGDDLTGEGGASWLALVGWAVLAIIVAGGAYLWLSREQIAGDLIDGYLADTGLEASYDIVSIGAQQQVIANVVIGDPASPDLTIERVSVDVSYGFGAPDVGAITLERPRLYGAYRDGALSFGALDPVLFPKDDTSEAGLPALDVTVKGGGARLLTDFGEVGAFLEGSGQLDDGFAGKLALVTPQMRVDDCGMGRSSAYGDFSIDSGVPAFTGPVRLRDVACQGVAVATADIASRLSTDADFAKLEGAFSLETGAIGYAVVKAKAMKGRATLSLSEEALILDHDITLAGLESAYAALGTLRADGALRSGRGFSQTSWNAKVEGDSITLASGATGALKGAQEASEGTLIASLLSKLESGLSAATRSASFTGDVTARADGDALSVVIPEARLRSASGETVLALSRVNWSVQGASAPPRLAGNFLTGGRDLPQITGRIDQNGNAPLSARLSVAPYRAGADQIAIPALSVRGLGASGLGGGGFAFAGTVKASGAIPGGLINTLEVPLNGRYDPRVGLRLGMTCETVRFDALSLYDLSLGAKSLEVCPEAGGAMLAYQDTLEIGVLSDGLTLTGDLAGSPLALSSRGARLSYPGGFALTDVAATIGEDGNAMRLTSAVLNGGFDEAIAGDFVGAEARLDAIALDLTQIAGRWSYEDSILRVDDARFTLTERTADGLEPRFNPLSAQGAVLSLAENQITARANLLHKASGTPVTDVAITHNLSSAEGSADLAVDALTFGPALSVADLSDLAKGVIAYTDGTVTGEGRIDWVGEQVTSRGVFRTDDLDLAAAFGPVTGLKGEIVFADLLNMTTAPSQIIEIGSINPGIEALAGKVRFSLTGGQTIKVEDARWPFMGGELIMRPTTLLYGTDNEQSYVFEIIALDAATFVSQMELSNIGASGTFDGTVGITFDARGNGRIDQGLLLSQAPGGTVSYIGELTYEDMGAISNYAFQALRSLDYKQMSVGLEGDLAGEIITRFTFDGVRQGEAANSDFITRRLAKLPIRFKINVRSENFYELATMVRTFWDPEALPDAVDVGVFSLDELRQRQRQIQGVPFAPTPGTQTELPQTNRPTTNRPTTNRSDEPTVQPLESETRP